MHNIFSFNSERDSVKIKIVVSQIVDGSGIGVDNFGLHATRRTKYRLNQGITTSDYCVTSFAILAHWLNRFPFDIDRALDPANE